jgi:carboxylesterase type B
MCSLSLRFRHSRQVILVLFDDHHEQSQSIWWVSTGPEQSLTQWMETTWTTFAATGDVGRPAGAIAWEPYDATRDNYIILDDSLRTAEGFRTDACRFWDNIDMP